MRIAAGRGRMTGVVDECAERVSILIVEADDADVRIDQAFRQRLQFVRRTAETVNRFSAMIFHAPVARDSLDESASASHTRGLSALRGFLGGNDDLFFYMLGIFEI